MNHLNSKTFSLNIWKRRIENDIRPFQHYGFFKLLRMKSFFLVCKHNLIISNLNKIYENFSKVLGKRLVNKLVDVLYCDLLTGGSNFEDLERKIKSLKKENVISIIDYCREFLTKDEENKADEIVKTYLKTIDIASDNSKQNFIAVKLSSLCDIEIMKRFNSVQFILDLITNCFIKDSNIEVSNVNSKIVEMKNLFNGVQFQEITKDQFYIIKDIHNSPLGLNILSILKRNDPKELELIKNIFNLEANFLAYGIIFYNRVDEILKYGLNKRCSVMIDAEQSYIQIFIDSCAKFFSFNYNKEFCTVLQTVQCYLKESYHTSQEYLNFLKKNNLKIGVKIVRGAYMTEEAKLAQRFNYENPIFPTIEETHKSYNSLIEVLLGLTNKDDKIIIASHNEDSIKNTTKYINEKNKYSIYSAQLVGISEHITIVSQKNDLQTCKYIPFGDIDIMIPYLIRRAEESAIMSKLKIQNSYLNEELKIRLLKPLALVTSLMILHLYSKKNH